MKVRSFVFLTVILFFCMAHAEEQDELTRARDRMVNEDLASRGISDIRVLRAMRKVPRHLFVDRRFWDQAYADHPLPIDEGQTISQPYVVALMTQALGIKPGQQILEIGTGSGYQAAILAELTHKVYTVEIKKTLAQKACETLKKLGYSSVHVKQGNGYRGWEKYAPYDAILVTCAATHIPPLLRRQLKEGGKLIIPLGKNRYYQTLTLVTRKGDTDEIEDLADVSFVPMTGEVPNHKPN